ncbi:MAG: tetratricopeptide repeat protein [Terriglobia bacterium]
MRSATLPQRPAPFAHALEPESNWRRWALIAAASIVVGSAAAGVWYYLGRQRAPSPEEFLTESAASSLENVFNKAESGMLVTPWGTSAYDDFLQAKQERGISAAQMAASRERILPAIKEQGEALFQRWHDYSSLSMEDWKNLERLYSWGVELDAATTWVNGTRLDRELQARLQYVQGQLQYLQGHFAGAERHYAEAARLAPHWALPVNALGRTALQRGDRAAAEAYYKRAIELEPNWVYPYMNLGSLYVGNQRNDMAVNYYQQAAKLAPSKPTVHYSLGRAYETLGQFHEARREYELILQLVRENPSDEIDPVELRQRIDSLRGASSPPATPPPDYSARIRELLDRAEKEFERRQYKNALYYCDQALQLDPDHGEARALKEKIQQTMRILGIK